MEKLDNGNLSVCTEVTKYVLECYCILSIIQNVLVWGFFFNVIYFIHIFLWVIFACDLISYIQIIVEYVYLFSDRIIYMYGDGVIQKL